MNAHEVNKLSSIVAEVVAILEIKDDAYGSSWKSKGGYSAFFNLERKSSRLETAAAACQYDIFKACIEIPGTLDALKDLIGYAILIIAEVAMEDDEGKFVLHKAKMQMSIDERVMAGYEPEPQGYVDQDQEWEQQKDREMPSAWEIKPGLTD